MVVAPTISTAQEIIRKFIFRLYFQHMSQRKTSYDKFILPVTCYFGRRPVLIKKLVLTGRSNLSLFLSAPFSIARKIPLSPSGEYSLSLSLSLSFCLSLLIVKRDTRETSAHSHYLPPSSFLYFVLFVFTSSPQSVA